MEELKFVYEVSGDDFTRAGDASSNIKAKLRQMGVDNSVIRRVAIAMYEGEINMVIHANGGTITVTITDDNIHLELADVGPGIPDIEKALTAGYSTAPAEVRALGFGAGMGLPNMKKNSDHMEIETELGVGTTVRMDIEM